MPKFSEGNDSWEEDTGYIDLNEVIIEEDLHNANSYEDEFEKEGEV